jgi:hypothetical protein
MKFIHSDFMQRGASLSPSQLIKLITRGKTSRLSVEPLLEFFRPLEAWLETQNRDERVSIFQYHNLFSNYSYYSLLIVADYWMVIANG